MSVVLRPTTMKVRNEGEEFQGFNVVADEKVAEKVAALEAKGQEVLESIPSDYSELVARVEALEEAINS